jgi:hypothetical protein
MKKYTLRFFFDYGSGVCLWAADKATNTTFGYAITVSQLPLSTPLKADIAVTITRYDTSLDWNNPGGESTWTESEWKQFDRAAQQLVARIQEELQAEFEVRNEHTIS